MQLNWGWILILLWYFSPWASTFSSIFQSWFELFGSVWTWFSLCLWKPPVLYMLASLERLGLVPRICYFTFENADILCGFNGLGYCLIYRERSNVLHETMAAALEIISLSSFLLSYPSTVIGFIPNFVIHMFSSFLPFPFSVLLQSASTCFFHLHANRVDAHGYITSVRY